MLPVQENQIEVDGVSLTVDRVGRGEPVLCLTAIGHDAHDFDALAKLVGDRFELFRVEWPGHGRSGEDSKPVSATRYAELVDGLVARLGLSRPLIIGNSIGGAAAILHACRHPVRGLVLCDSGGLIEIDRTVQRFCGAFERFFAAGERGVGWYGPAFALYYRLVLPAPAAKAQRRRIVAAGRRSAPVLRQAWASFGRPEADLRAAAAQIDAPIWVAWARRDRVIPLKACRPAIERLRHVTLTEFDAGHSAFLEQPDAFARGFLEFVDGALEQARPPVGAVARA